MINSNVHGSHTEISLGRPKQFTYIMLAISEVMCTVRTICNRVRKNRVYVYVLKFRLPSQECMRTHVLHRSEMYI